MPVLSSDSIASEDLLGRRKFAVQIVNSLTKAFAHLGESLVIGINGPWGSGKSTLLSFLQQELNSHYKTNQEVYRIINFNPWASSTLDTDELQRSLLEVIIRELESIDWKEKVEEKNNRFRSYLRYLNYLKFTKYIHPVAGKIFDVIDEYTKDNPVHSLDDVKEQADKLIEDKGIRLYVLLDDLDRLNSKEITAIFKVIKLNANFSNTCFIIAYDKKIVTAALDEQYGDKGEEYLEKIVQVDFSVPEIMDENMEELFVSGLRQLFTSFAFEFDEDAIIKIWKYHGLREYFRTLRDIKRYINSLLFSLPAIIEEINLMDYLVLEAIKVFDFSAYQKIHDDFLIIQRKAIWGGTNAFDHTTISQFGNSTTKSLLDYLFVQKGSIAHLIEGSVNEKRLADPEFFKRYYTLYLPSRDITQDTLTQFLVIGKNREQLLLEILQKGRMKNFLRRLSDSDLPKFYQVKDLYVLDSLLRFWDRNDQEITTELDEYLWHSYFNLAHTIADKHGAAKEAVANLVLTDKEQRSLRFYFNYYIILSNEEKRSDKELRGKISEQVDIILPIMKIRFKEYLVNMANTYCWKAERGQAEFITRLFVYALAKYCPNEYPDLLGTHLTTDGFQIFLVKSYFVGVDQKSRPSRIDLSKQTTLLPGKHYDDFISYLNNAKKGTWNEEDHQLVDYFLKSLNGDD